MTGPRLVIFDCDGTLVDSQYLIVAAMNRAFDKVRMAPPPRDAILGIVGLSLPEAIWRLTGGGDEGTLTRIRDGYSNAFTVLRQDPAHNEPMYEGALEAVHNLARDPGTVLGIATGKSRRGIDRLLEKFDLKHCFQTIQTADTAPSKPHPAMIEKAIKETGVTKGRTIMIGDTAFDMAMARDAGAIGLGVSWGYHPVQRLEAEGAHAVAADYPHLMQLLAGLHASEVAAQ